MSLNAQGAVDERLWGIQAHRRYRTLDETVFEAGETSVRAGASTYGVLETM
jgi:hypothetical protein